MLSREMISSHVHKPVPCHPFKAVEQHPFRTQPTPIFRARPTNWEWRSTASDVVLALDRRPQIAKRHGSHRFSPLGPAVTPFT